MAETANRSRDSGRRVRGAFAPEARCGYRNPTLSSILATQMPLPQLPERCYARQELCGIAQGRFFTFRPGGIPTGQRWQSSAFTGLPGWKTAPLCFCCFQDGRLARANADGFNELPAPMWRFAIITSRLTIIGTSAPLHGIVQFVFHLNGLAKRILMTRTISAIKRRRNANGKDERQPQPSTHRQGRALQPRCSTS